jgi:hypothetical protein
MHIDQILSFFFNLPTGLYFLINYHNLLTKTTMKILQLTIILNNTRIARQKKLYHFTGKHLLIIHSYIFTVVTITFISIEKLLPNV